MAAAIVQDVLTSLGRAATSSDETAQIDLWLNDAEMQIRLRLGDVALLDQDALQFVEREAVVLKARNPDGKQSEGIDDYRYSLNGDSARGQVVILDEWWDLLTPDGSNAAFSITPSGDPYVAEAYSTVSREWWDL